jgi:hypothetical protein
MTTERDRNGSRGSPAQRSSIMRSFSSLRLALLSVSLITNLGNVGTAFAHTTDTQQQMAPQAHQPSYASPYDSPDFVLDESNIFG